MKILLVHNEYLGKGGEDTVLKLEEEMLLKNNHSIEKYLESNKNLNNKGLKNKITNGINTIWSNESYKKFSKVLDQFEPDIIHVHNTFPLISPSIYKAAKLHKIPVVQTLHNYRLICANGLLLKNGLPCDLCVGKTIAVDAIKNKCYRDSSSATSAVVGMQALNKINGNYYENVDAYICLTNFAASLMKHDGFPEDKIYVKPNFLGDIDNYKTNDSENGKNNKFIYVGKVSEEKGVEDILKAFSNRIDDFELTIVGEGPELKRLMSQYSNFSNIRWTGWLNSSLVKEEIGKNDYLVMGSRWYEGFPMVLLEAMSLGKPTIVPNHAGFPSIVNEDNGLLFEPNNINSLSKVLDDAINLKNSNYKTMSKNAYEDVIMKYSEEVNYRQLMGIYSNVLNKK